MSKKFMNVKRQLGYVLNSCREGLLENVMDNLNYPYNKIPIQELIEQVAEVADSAEYWHFTSRTGSIRNLSIESNVNVDINKNEIEVSFNILGKDIMNYKIRLASLDMTFNIQKKNWFIEPVTDKRDIYCFWYFRTDLDWLDMKNDSFSYFAH